MKILTLLLLLATAGTAAAGGHPPYSPEVRVEPVQPTALQPLRLHFQTWCTVGSPANPFVARNGFLLTVTADPGGCITSYPPPDDEPFHVDIASLEPGTYTVHLRIRGASAGSAPRVTFPFVVAPAYTGEYAPRLRIEPAIPNSLQPITLQFTTWCLLANDPNPVLERLPGNILRVKVHGAGCVGYPPRPDAPLVVDAGRLEPGDYFVELADYESYPYEFFYRTAIKVTPGPGRLRDGRFDLQVSWRTAGGESGTGTLAREPTRDSALFYFFSPENWELMVKVLDGCSINGHYWVFAAASTDVAYDVVVTDLLTARTYSFGNRAGEPAVALTELNAFPCN